MIKFENQENGRYFYIQVERDLFDELCLRVVRGGRHVRGISHIVTVGSRKTIRAEIKRLSRLRLQRGYTLIND